jgi:hypothetical protein
VAELAQLDEVQRPAVRERGGCDERARVGHRAAW